MYYYYGLLIQKLNKMIITTYSKIHFNFVPVLLYSIYCELNKFGLTKPDSLMSVFS